MTPIQAAGIDPAAAGSMRPAERGDMSSPQLAPSRRPLAARVIAATAVLAVLTGCSAGPDSSAGLSDNGGQVHISAGDVFDVVLPSDYAQSNCQWHDKETNDWGILRPLGSRYEPQRALPGHPDTGTSTARFKAVKAGSTTVTLVQEDNSGRQHVNGSYTITVVVD